MLCLDFRTLPSLSFLVSVQPSSTGKLQARLASSKLPSIGRYSYVT